MNKTKRNNGYLGPGLDFKLPTSFNKSELKIIKLSLEQLERRLKRDSKKFDSCILSNGIFGKCRKKAVRVLNKINKELDAK